MLCIMVARCFGFNQQPPQGEPRTKTGKSHQQPPQHQNQKERSTGGQRISVDEIFFTLESVAAKLRQMLFARCVMIIAFEDISFEAQQISTMCARMFVYVCEGNIYE